jgi:LmbE family N-acetylglucosaminyl deacetylase
MTRARGRLALLIGALVMAGGCGGPASRASDRPVDLMVFAPHPDDESLGCSGIVLQALKRGEKVKVVLFTNGDGFPAFASLIGHRPIDRLGPADFKELARYRQRQSQEAHRILGAPEEDLIFLGYPDSGLDPVFRIRGEEPYRQKHTGMSETYGVAQQDRHSTIRGRPAPYRYESVLGDLVELLRTFPPRRISVTSEADGHPDHRAAFRFVRDAVDRTGWSGELDTYLIHGGPEWPWPTGSTPEAPYEAHEVKGKRIPEGVPWPPSRRIPLSAEEVAGKRKAVLTHASHLSAVTEGPLLQERVYLESFVKSEEVFWRTERRP